MKEIHPNPQDDLQEELLPEYDLDYAKAQPNRFAMRSDVKPLRIIALYEDVAEVFATPQAVNEALRSLIKAKRIELSS